MDQLSDFKERLHRTATVTRDLIAFGNSDRWEIYVKASTLCESTFSHVTDPQVIRSEETGVAVRGYHQGRAGFAAASGLEVDAARRAVDGAVASACPLSFDPIPPLHLLGQTGSGESVRPPAEWAQELVSAVARAVQRRSEDRLEIRLVVVQEGTYSWILTNSESFVASFEGANTTLLVEAALRHDTPGVWREWLHIPSAEYFDCDAVAAQITDRALLETGPMCEETGLWDVILHPEVAAGFIASLVPLFLARPGEDDPIAALVNRDGQLTGEDLTLIDDRIGSGVPIVSPCDGEGLPATRTLLLENGIPRHRLASYRDAMLCGEVPRGGAVRHSYRDYPSSGISNLRVDTSDGVTPVELLGRAGKCLYLLRPLSGVRLSADDDEYRILASGVWISRGKILGRQPVVELRGSIAQLLRRLDGIGTDLCWYQTEAGLVGAPSILIRSQRI